MVAEPIKVLDFGYVRMVECWGHGDAGVESVDLALPIEDGSVQSVDYPTDYECGIIEAARQSTQGNFRGWVRVVKCPKCGRQMECENKPAYCNTITTNCNVEMEEVHPGDRKLLAFLFNNKHSTPFEFSGMTIEVQAPILVFREWHRHRVQSFEESGLTLDSIDTTAFNEMSGRYAPLPDVNYTPSTERLLQVNEAGRNKQAGNVMGTPNLTEADAYEFRSDLDAIYKTEQLFYEKWLSRGAAKELARLPVGVGRYSKMRASTNLRNWCAFITLRMDPASQWEIREYAKAVYTIASQTFPRTMRLFDEARK